MPTDTKPPNVLTDKTYSSIEICDTGLSGLNNSWHQNQTFWGKDINVHVARGLSEQYHAHKNGKHLEHMWNCVWAIHWSWFLEDSCKQQTGSIGL